MFHPVYVWLQKLGYTHPIHPMVTHIPVGLTLGTLVFGLVSLIFRRVRLKLTAWHCALLAVISVVPTAFLGFMDWEEIYKAQWMPVIVAKMILAGCLFVTLLVALLLGRRRDGEDESARPWRNPRSIVALVLYFALRH